jgi:endogenous inhibitor of DNA gyrase (YacG/DUF329 family)
VEEGETMTLECPYCEKEVEPDDDLREPNENIERECPNCGKTFLYQIEYFPSYTSRIVPCLNGEPHNYQEIRGFPEEYYRNRRRCTYCDDEIVVKDPNRLTEEDYEKIKNAAIDWQYLVAIGGGMARKSDCEAWLTQRFGIDGYTGRTITNAITEGPINFYCGSEGTEWVLSRPAPRIEDYPDITFEDERRPRC